MGISGLFRFATVAVAAMGASLAASAGHAGVVYEFAEYSQLPNAAPNAFWDNPGDTTNAMLNTGGYGKTSSVPVQFSFLNNPALASVNDIAANLQISGGVVGVAATKTPIVDQQGVFGVFSITSVSDFFVGLTHYSAGTVLLAGSFTKGDLSGRGPNGSAIASTPHSTVSFTSDVVGALTASMRHDLTLSFSAISPNLNAATGAALRTFQANNNGQFDQGVPEPATWTMLILGLGGLGAASRRRRATI
jgi:hypothetical protein